MDVIVGVSIYICMDTTVDFRMDTIVGVKTSAPYHPRRPRRSIKLDTISARDLRVLNPQLFCNNCSHYSSTNQTCTMGYRAQHTREIQMGVYAVTGKMALCRFLEID